MLNIKVDRSILFRLCKTVYLGYVVTFLFIYSIFTGQQQFAIAGIRISLVKKNKLSNMQNLFF